MKGGNGKWSVAYRIILALFGKVLGIGIELSWAALSCVETEGT